MSRSDTLRIRDHIAETKLTLLRNAQGGKRHYSNADIGQMGGSHFVGLCMRDLRAEGWIDNEGGITAAGRTVLKEWERRRGQT